jgi:hypothetical protein
VAANGGGGLYMSASGQQVENSLIWGNIASAGGGGLWAQAGSPSLVNCTIAHNTSSNTYPGGVMSWGAVVLTNCIVRPNYYTGGSIYSNWGFGGYVQMAYSCTAPTNGLTGAGNLQADPLFAAAGDYRLAAGSPCIDKGTTLDGMAGGTDVAGKPRVVNVIVDMGAYEYEAASRAKGTVLVIR